MSDNLLEDTESRKCPHRTGSYIYTCIQTLHVVIKITYVVFLVWFGRVWSAVVCV